MKAFVIIALVLTLIGAPAHAFPGTRPAPRPSARATLAPGRAVFVNKTRKVWHEAGCRYVKPTSTAVSLEVADKIRPCKVCHPDAMFGAVPGAGE